MHVRLQPARENAVFWPRCVAASVLSLSLLLGAGAGAYASPGPAASLVVVAVTDFGSPPSGEIPILYNDHHVYAKPDVLRASRVLAALVKNGTIFVPLRSMFEQMGATVSYDAATKSFTVEKSGASIRLVLGKQEAVINGETRPLDQGPIMYQGVALVPIRVISETMGAYVEWVPAQHIAVVRYIPPTPVPTAPPTVPPTAPPTPTPTPIAPSYSVFLQGAYSWSGVYNEFAATQCCRSYLLSGAFAPEDSKFAIKVDYRQDTYVTSDNLTDTLGNHYTRFGTIDGGIALTPVFNARQSNFDARLEYQVTAPRMYVGVGYLQTANNYGYPHLNGLGGGIEKLPELRSGVSWFGSAFYYPSASGNYTVTDPASVNVGTAYRQQYQILKYDLGLAFVVARSPVYVYGGFSGDQYVQKQNAPIGQTHSGPYVGLGVKF
ncbi:MAG: copper amine oxidase N-terminal domain-containing protein [Candidatus Eremiobacteraeota bacterium]|nr:copper amine oxidase N-terminal domain-containing protein [Candidatus Eremiobacteraeota bacterium]